jgi:predicted PurR-regulated permease PerM
MQQKNFSTYFFFAILFGLIILAFFIMKPFLIPLLFGAILAHLFNPVYKFLLKYIKLRWLSSLLVCFLIALIIIIPVIVIFSLVMNEAQFLANYFANNPDAINNFNVNLVRSLSSLHFSNLYLRRFVSQDSLLSAIKSFSQGTLYFLQGAYAGILHFAFMLLIMSLSVFYLFIDGEELVKRIMSVIPLSNQYEETLLARFNSVVKATIKGTIIVGIVEGIIGGLLFWIAKVPSPIFFGMLIAVSSAIPPLGAAIVWVPAGVILLIMGNLIGGFAILFFGLLLLVITMDTIIRPRFIGKDTKMNPLMILFSTLGGIAFFGISGFIIGPVIMSFFSALLDIYILEFKTEKE